MLSCCVLVVKLTNGGRQQYLVSVCNQSIHRPTQRSLLSSPTPFNPFILLMHLSIHPPSSNRFVLHVVQMLQFNPESQFAVYLCAGMFSIHEQVWRRLLRSAATPWFIFTPLFLVPPGRRPVSPQPVWRLRWSPPRSCGGLQALLKGTLSPVVVERRISSAHSCCLTALCLSGLRISTNTSSVVKLCILMHHKADVTILKHI